MILAHVPGESLFALHQLAGSPQGKALGVSAEHGYNDKGSD
jgi:hypothetical protein